MARRRQRSLNLWGTVVAFAIVMAAAYWFLWSGAGPDNDTAARREENKNHNTNDMMLTGVQQSDGPSVTAAENPRPTASQPTISTDNAAPSDHAEGLRLFDLGNQALQSGDLVNARTQLSQALRSGLPEAKAAAARHTLLKLAQDMIFSSARTAGDPLVSTYIVQSGDSLTRIAKAHKIPAELIARINNIADKNKIRAGQTLKIIEGPFHAVIHKNAYSMDVYLQDYLVDEFPVGLGEDGSTPTGTWKIKDRLVNPTYYPPRGGDIIYADDPANPLGERWLGLEGVSGEAHGQMRYGIHGTIEPESIGKNASLGCIRMHNDDVELLFDLLVVEHSRVTVIE